MTITVGTLPAHNTAAELALGFLTGGVVGASLTAFVGGCATGEAWAIVGGLGLPALYGLAFFLCTLPRRRREAAVVPCTALAVIESREAFRGEASDVPVRFELSVVPDDAPAFRVETQQDVNVVELPDYRPGGIVVVAYPPDRPWKVRIVKRPTPQWEERAAGARLDSVPGPAVRSDPEPGSAGGFLTLFGLLLGVGAVLLLFRADAFGSDASGPPPRPSATSSSSWSSSTTTVTSATGTVTLGPGRSMLDPGELRRSVESLTQGKDGRHALTVVVQDRLLTVVHFSRGVKAAGFDPRSLPYERVPALVREAAGTLGADSPRSWQLTADGLTGPLTLRVVVTGDGRTATLEADAQGNVLRRTRS